MVVRSLVSVATLAPTLLQNIQSIVVRGGANLLALDTLRSLALNGTIVFKG